jgi:hypothetical protein
MGDREFIQRCEKEGIKVFAVLWEAQGYNDILVGVKNGKIVSWMRRGGKRRGTGWMPSIKTGFPSKSGDFLKKRGDSDGGLVGRDGGAQEPA